METVRTASCLCGSVSFRIDGLIRNVIKCYCTQCRKTSGNYVAASNCLENQISFITKDTLTWYPSSDKLTRGFCSNCGGNVLIKVNGTDTYCIMAGAIDSPSKLKTIAEIYTAQKPDYLEKTDNCVTTELDFGYGNYWEKLNENKG